MYTETKDSFHVRAVFLQPGPLIILLLSVLISWKDCQAAGPVRIAAVFAKTGPAVVVSGLRPEFSAVEMAVSELNSRGGLLGRPVEVLEFDNRSTALGSRQAAEAAVRAGVTAVIGATRSSHSLGMAPVLQKAGTIMISPISTDPQVTLVGDYIFRVCYIDDFQGDVMAAFAVRDLKARKAVVLTNTSEKFSLSLSRFFKERFKMLGGEILWEGDYLGSATSFERQLSRVKRLRPDVCFVPGYDSDTGFIIRQARKMGITALFLSGDGLTDRIYKYAESHADGICYSSHWHPENAEKKSRQFRDTFEKKYSRLDEPSPALSYDAVMLFADAVTRAGSLDRDKIRNALAATRGFKGVTGEITFDANRNPVRKSAYILRFERGRSVYLKTVRP